jgi:co-chaperonin GroES (HSP10)
MVRPTGKYVLVKRDPLEVPVGYQKPERIILADKALAKSKSATVLKVGKDVTQVCPGDRVLITWLDGTPYEDADLGKVEFLLEEEILAYSISRRLELTV